MGFLTKKREADVVTVVSIAAAAVILTFFSSWLYFDASIEKIQSTYEIRIGMIKSGMETLQAKNRDLQEKLDKVKDAMTEEEVPE